MTLRQLMSLAGVFVLACVTMVTMQAQGGGAAAPAQAAAGRVVVVDGRPHLLPTRATLVIGAWGTTAVPLDARGWGWQTKS